MVHVVEEGVVQVIGGSSGQRLASAEFISVPESLRYERWVTRNLRSHPVPLRSEGVVGCLSMITELTLTVTFTFKG